MPLVVGEEAQVSTPLMSNTLAVLEVLVVPGRLVVVALLGQRTEALGLRELLPKGWQVVEVAGVVPILLPLVESVALEHNQAAAAAAAAHVPPAQVLVVMAV